MRRITDAPIAQNTVKINREKYELVKDGVQVQYHDSKEEPVIKRFRVIDFENLENNHFLCVRELWVNGDIYRRRTDIVGLLNGLPLLFIACKTMHKDIRYPRQDCFNRWASKPDGITQAFGFICESLH